MNNKRNKIETFGEKLKFYRKAKGLTQEKKINTIQLLM